MPALIFVIVKPFKKFKMKKLLSTSTALFMAVLFAAFIDPAFGLTAIIIASLLFAASLFIKLPAGVSFMAIVYPSNCDEVDLAHQCDDCEDPELGRVRGIAFIKSDFAFSNPASYTEWFNGIAAGDIIIVPFTRGSFDGGTPKEGTGYGDQATKYIGTDYSLTYFDPNYAVNRDFYNNIKRFQNYKVAYKTETKVHITDKVCQVLPKAPVQDDITSEVVWEVMVKWSSQNEPTPYTAPDNIFICFEVS
jgi:hypothetical protein